MISSSKKRCGIIAGSLLAFTIAAQAEILIGQTAGISGPVAAGVAENIAGAMLLHNPVNHYVFNVRTSYRPEAEKAVDYLATLA